MTTTTVNPFNITAPVATPSVLAQAVNSTAIPTSTGYTAASIAAPKGYTAGVANSVDMTAEGYGATGSTAKGYDAAQSDLDTWKVDKNQTVASNLDSILSANSPLLQKARADSLRQMNARGLINSSMAIGAGENAVIQNALPIAQQDATTYANAGRFNAESANANNQFNTGQTNSARQYTAGAENANNQFNAGQVNAASQFTATAKNNAAAQNQAAKNQIALANTQEANRASEYLATAANTAAAANQRAQNEAAQYTAQAANNASLAYASALNASVTNQLNNALAAATQNADNTTQLQLAAISATAQSDLANIEAAYKIQMQTSASATDMFQQTTKNITDLMLNPDLGDAARQEAVNLQTSYLQGSMEILEATSGISGLGALINFG